MTEPVILEILKQYGLDGAAVRSVKKGYRNTSVHATSGGSDYNLMLYKRELGILNTIKGLNSVGLHLHKSGFPARYPLDLRILQVYSGESPLYAGLYNYLPGTTIPWEGYTRKHLTAIGQTLGEMHVSLQNFGTTDDLPRISETLLTLLGNTQTYTERSGVKLAMSSKLKLAIAPNAFVQASALVGALSQANTRQVLHMDFVRGNLLFDDSARVTGVIDFEKASYGHPLFDIARTLAFLYVDCKYKQPCDVHRAFLMSGYQKRSGAAIPRITHRGKDRTNEVLERLVTVFLLHDFYKFLLHNPYENLGDNAHFIRTRDELIKRHVLVLN